MSRNSENGEDFRQEDEIDKRQGSSEDTVKKTNTALLLEATTHNTRSIRNPYASKIRNISAAPSTKESEQIANSSAAAGYSYTSALKSSVSASTIPATADRTADDTARNEVSVGTSTLNSNAPTTLEELPTNATIIAPAATATTRTGFGNNLPYWERLPSRNISFGPAEILTVAECIEHAALYLNKSVRITGILHHRSYLPGNGKDDVIVQLELKDPLVQKEKQETGRRSTYQRPSRGLSLPGRQLSVPTNDNTARLSTSSLLSRRKRKRPWFATTSTSNPAGSTLGRRPNTGSILTSSCNSNRPSSLLPAKQQRQKEQILKVVVDPMMSQLDAAVVGSVIMVMGMVVSIDNNENTTFADEDKEKLHEQLQASVQQESKQSPIATYKVNARILQVLPKIGADMSFFTTALHARRKAMYQRYYQSNSSPVSIHNNDMRKSSASVAPATNTEGDSATSSVLLQGCGPPPYDKFQ